MYSHFWTEIVISFLKAPHEWKLNCLWMTCWNLVRREQTWILTILMDHVVLCPQIKTWYEELKGNDEGRKKADGVEGWMVQSRLEGEKMRRRQPIRNCFRDKSCNLHGNLGTLPLRLSVVELWKFCRISIHFSQISHTSGALMEVVCIHGCCDIAVNSAKNCLLLCKSWNSVITVC